MLEGAARAAQHGSGEHRRLGEAIGATGNKAEYQSDLSQAQLFGH